MRVLGIDYGDKRIGLALSDPTGTLATPLRTLTYRLGKRPPLAEIERIAREAGAERLVVGLPLDLGGDETERCARVREIGEKLSGRLAIPVDYQDERMTSVRAESIVRGSGRRKSQRERRGLVDAAAAALILQLWLDRRRPS